MANFLSEDKKQDILALLRLKHSQRKIERETGVNRETVSRYGKEAGLLPSDRNSKPANVPLGSDKVPTGSAHCSRSFAAPYQGKIEESIAIGLTAQRIYQDLREEGFTGKYCSIKRFVKKLKKQKPDICARIEVPAGCEAQVDYGQGAPALDPVSGKYKKPHVFRMVLSFSRHSYEEVMWKQDAESFIRAHENAFRSFGGVPTVIVLDNLKAGIINACFYDPTINPVYRAFAQHYGCEVLPCRVRKPEHKGKVEAGVNYVQENALKGRKFESLEAENLFLKEWNKNIAGTRIHGTVKEQVITRFKDKEQKALKPLPDTPFKMFKIGKRRVHVDGHIEVEGAYYSVPCEYLGEDVTVHCDTRLIRIYNQKAEEIAIHMRQLKGHFKTLENHLPETKRWSQVRVENRLKEQSAKLGKEVSDWAEKVLEKRGLLAYRVLQGVISLTRKYSSEQINFACGEALKFNGYRYHLIKRLCEKSPVKKEIELKQEDEIIRPLLEYAI